MSFVADIMGGIFGGDGPDVPDPSQLPTDPRKDPRVRAMLRGAVKTQRTMSAMGRSSTILSKNPAAAR